MPKSVAGRSPALRVLRMPCTACRSTVAVLRLSLFPGFARLNVSYDFLPSDGQRVPCTEEIPVYNGLVAVGYRLFGEQDWIPRAISLGGCLVAIGVFCGLVRREYDARFAVVAGILFASCPLLIFYAGGRWPTPGCSPPYRSWNTDRVPPKALPWLMSTTSSVSRNRSLLHPGRMVCRRRTSPASARVEGLGRRWPRQHGPRSGPWPMLTRWKKS